MLALILENVALCISVDIYSGKPLLGLVYIFAT